MIVSKTSRIKWQCFLTCFWFGLGHGFSMHLQRRMDSKFEMREANPEMIRSHSWGNRTEDKLVDPISGQIPQNSFPPFSKLLKFIPFPQLQHILSQCWSLCFFSNSVHSWNNSSNHRICKMADSLFGMKLFGHSPFGSNLFE